MNSFKYDPADNEVVIDYHNCRVFRAFVDTTETRPLLQHVFVNRKEMVATNGHALVKVPVEQVNTIKHRGCRLIHHEALLHVRKKGHVLVVNLETGEQKIHGSGPMFPLILPKADEDFMGQPYPKYTKIVEDTDASKKVALVGIDPALLKQVMMLARTVPGGIYLEIPENGVSFHGEKAHVTTGIPFRVKDSKATGILMPLRVI